MGVVSRGTPVALLSTTHLTWDTPGEVLLSHPTLGLASLYVRAVTGYQVEHCMSEKHHVEPAMTEPPEVCSHFHCTWSHHLVMTGRNDDDDSLLNL